VCYLSAKDFEMIATAAESSPREILRRWRKTRQ